MDGFFCHAFAGIGKDKPCIRFGIRMPVILQYASLTSMSFPIVSITQKPSAVVWRMVSRYFLVCFSRCSACLRCVISWWVAEIQIL
jgi:hypothetical protein